MRPTTSCVLFSLVCSTFAQQFCTRESPLSACERGVPGTKNQGDLDAVSFTKNCGSTPALAVQEFLNLSANVSRDRSDTGARTDATTLISLFFHVITNKNQDSNALVPQSTLDAQVRIMNKVYTKAGFLFRLDGVDRQSNDDWVSGAAEAPDSKYQFELSVFVQGSSMALVLAKRTDETDESSCVGLGARVLRNGTYDTLNIYILSNLFNAQDFYGVCEFPNPAVRNRNLPVDPLVLQRDGCEIDIISLPGSPNHPEANLGKEFLSCTFRAWG
jgi:hypothetical protein